MVNKRVSDAAGLPVQFIVTNVTVCIHWQLSDQESDTIDRKPLDTEFADVDDMRLNRQTTVGLKGALGGWKLLLAP